MNMSKAIKEDKIVFIGDSITQSYNLEKYIPSFNIINEGISGNTTNDVLNRLDTIVFKHQDIIFLLIGTNDLAFTPHTNDEIIDNIKEIIKTIQIKLPTAKIFVQSIYPVNYEVNPLMVGKRNNTDILYINKYVQNIEGTTYIDIHNVLQDENGKLNKVYTNDGLHINTLGYEVITKVLIKMLRL